MDRTCEALTMDRELGLSRSHGLDLVSPCDAPAEVFVRDYALCRRCADCLELTWQRGKP